MLKGDDIFPIILSVAERCTIRKYLEASQYHAMSNESAIKALNSIDSMQDVLHYVFAHLMSCEDESQINVDVLMNRIQGRKNKRNL